MIEQAGTRGRYVTTVEVARGTLLAAVGPMDSLVLDQTNEACTIVKEDSNAQSFLSKILL